MCKGNRLIKRYSGGFSLIEMAMVLVIIGLLLGGALGPLSTRVEAERRNETADSLARIRDALLGYAVVNGRLPCADTNGDGAENSPCGFPGVEGDVPWQTLDLGRLDAWGHPVRYRADSALTTVNPDLSVLNDGLAITDVGGTPLTSTPVAIVFSCGKDGLPNGENDANGAVNNNSTCINPGAPNAVYVQNIGNNNFDDILIWVSRNTLLNRAVAANRWPP